MLARRALRLDARRQRRLEEGQRRVVEETVWKEALLNVQGVELLLARVLTEAQAARQDRHMQPGSRHMRYGEQRAAPLANGFASHSSSPATAAAAGRGSDPRVPASRLEGINGELDKRERVMNWVVACWKRSQDLVPAGASQLALRHVGREDVVQEDMVAGRSPRDVGAGGAGGGGGRRLSESSVRSIKSGTIESVVSGEAMERVPHGERDWNEYVIDALLCKLYVVEATRLSVCLSRSLVSVKPKP